MTKKGGVLMLCKKNKRSQVVFIIVTLVMVMSSLMIELPMAFAANYQDPFRYINDSKGKGIYPENSTTLYQGNNRSEAIRNYKYETEPGRIPYWDRGFDGGYHQYQVEQGDVYTKKIVKPTDDPTVFDVQLDVLGGYKKSEEKKQVDIVFVVDKSTSMKEWIYDQYGRGKTRWRALTESVQRFTNNISSSPYIDAQYGLVGFGSLGETPITDVAKFSSGRGSTMFTSDANQLNQHEILSGGYLNNSGTPTVLGVSEGFNLLNDRNKGSRPTAEKVLIILTDGEPTFSYYRIANYLSNDYYSQYRYRYYNYYDSGGYRYSSLYGDGTNRYDASKLSQMTIDATNQYYKMNTGIAKYSIGLGLNRHSNKNIDNVLNSLGPNGSFTTMDTEGMDSILKNIENDINHNDFLKEMTLTDPMSDYVTMRPDTLKKSKIEVTSNTNPKITPSERLAQSDFTNQLVVDSNESGMTLSGVTLDGNVSERWFNGLRLTYQVQLKEAYQDGKFYPANGGTYVTSPKAGDFGFAVPSVSAKRPLLTLTFSKQDKNDDMPLSGARFRLSKENRYGDYDEIKQVTSDKGGQFSFDQLSEGLYVLDEVTAPKGYVKMTEPIYFEVEKSTEGFELEARGLPKNNVIYNDEKTTDLLLQKVADDNKTLLQGAEFTLYRTTNNKRDKVGNVTSTDNGFIHFTHLRQGTYELEETKAPRGYDKLIKPLTITIKYEESTDNLVTYGLPRDFKIMNQPTRYAVRVLKTDLDNKGLGKASFDLFKEHGNQSEELTTDNQGWLMFENLTRGRYRLIETKAPEGYDGIKDPIYFDIDIDGKVSLLDTSNDRITVHTKEDQFYIQVKNEETKRGMLPSTGGDGYTKYLIVAGTMFVLGLLLAGYYLYQKRKGRW